MKKIIILSILINLFITGTALALVQLKQFPDVERGSYYETAVNNMLYRGVVNGYNDGLFHPHDAVSRAQAVTMFDRYDQKLQENDLNSLKILVCQGFNENSSSNTNWKSAYQKLCFAPAEIQ